MTSPSQSDHVDVTKKGVKIDIALPCYGSKFDSVTAFSLMNLMLAWKTSGIEFTYSTLDVCDIELARNLLITNFYFARADSSHLLFIDNDLGFNTSMINRMINLGEDVVGVAAPRRSLNLATLHSKSNLPFEQALASAARFVSDRSSIKSEQDGFAEVSHCGTGILLISRNCINKMVTLCPEIVGNLKPDDFRKSALAPGLNRFLMPFNKIVSRDSYLSEDYSFCHRWTKKCQGKIFVNLDSYVQHVSRYIISSRFDDLP